MKPRKVIGMKAGVCREWANLGEFAQEFKVSIPSVTITLDRNGTLAGWKLFDTAEEYDRRINELQMIKDEIYNWYGK